jgi:small basic protein (TIGR04137 family)
MSIHSSLRGVSTLTGERSVLTRIERLAALKKEGKFTDERSVYGLPKVRTHFKVAGAKKKAKEAAGDKAAAGGTAAAPGATAAAATPAAAAKPAEKAGDKKKGDKK